MNQKQKSIQAITLFVGLLAGICHAQEPTDGIATAQMFGAVAGDKIDNTLAVQAAIDWAATESGSVDLHGELIITDTIKISGVNRTVVEQMSIKCRPEGLPISRKPSCLVWMGGDDKPMVECHILQRSTIALNLKNGNKSKGLTGFLWHNQNDRKTACNLNTVSLSVYGCELGLQLGDYSIGGNLRTTRPITATGMVFTDGFGVLLDGEKASSVNWTIGTRKSNGSAFTDRHGIVKATGFAGRFKEIKDGKIWSAVSNYSIFKKHLDEDTAVSKPGRYVELRDLGRELTYVFEADEQERIVTFDAAFVLANGEAKITVPANRSRVYKFICDGSAWVESSRSGHAIIKAE